MYQSFNQLQKSGNPGSVGSPNLFRTPYVDMNQNNFLLFDNNGPSVRRSSGADDDNDNLQVSPHLKSLFNSGERPTLEKKGSGHFSNGFDLQGSNVFPQNLILTFPGTNVMNFGGSDQAHPTSSAFQKELSSSNLSSNSRTVSVNNTSQETSHRIDNTSGMKNASSKARMKNNKNYQKVVNEDINLIERIETLLNQIALNHNKVCPFCSKPINIKRCNSQNISAFFSQSYNKYFLTHFDCYLKSRSDELHPKISAMNNLHGSTITTIQQTNFDPKSWKKVGRKPYFVTVEGFHPISSYLFFKIDRVCHALEHITQHNQILNIDLSKPGTSVFEPKMFMLPFNEFKLVFTMYHPNEDDPFVFEFLVDLTKLSLAPDQLDRLFEVAYNEDGSQIKFEAKILHDPTNDQKAQMNYSMSIDQNSSSILAGRPEFGRNVFLVLKHFTTNFPAFRQEMKRSSLSVASSEGIFSQKGNSQKRLSNKIHLTPDAPLFGSNTSLPTPVNKQSMQQPQSPINIASYNFTGSPGLKSQHPSSFKPQNVVNFNENQKVNTFNTPLFPKNFQLNPNGPNNNNNINNNNRIPQQEQDHLQQNSFIPPGLTGTFNLDSNFPPPQNFFNPQFMEPQNDPQEFFNGNHPFQQQPMMINKHPEPFENLQFNFPERSQTPELPGDGENFAKSRPKNHLGKLFPAVLMNEARKDSSIPNSPLLTKIKRDIFSGVSTPRSEPDTNMMSGFNNRFPGSHNDLGGDEGSATLPMTPLTDDMIDNFKIEDYQGRLVEYAKTYHGSRILQKFFPKANQQEIEMVIYEIQDKMEELMLDPYANYMFQTLAQSCSSEQRYHLLLKIAPSMIKVAKDRKGTHSLQAIVSLINRDIEDRLIRQTLDGHVLELAFDAQATHLIQKLVTSISIDSIGFIYDPIIRNFVEVANNSFGLCVLKQLMTKVEKIPELKKAIIQCLHDNLEDFIQNPYGNYAVQHAFDVYPRDCNIILNKIIEKIVQYSNQKFSSNVIEKCFVSISTEYQRRFVTEIVKSERLLELMKNKYGNYVILKILSTAELEDKKLLAQSLMKNINAVNVPKYKHRWIQFFEENPLKIPGLSTHTVKPSQFKPSEQSDISSPRSADGWIQDSSKKGYQNQRDEKSHFYHEKFKGPNSHFSQNNVGQSWDFGGSDEGHRNKERPNHQTWFVNNEHNDHPARKYSHNSHSGHNNNNNNNNSHHHNNNNQNHNHNNKSKNFNPKFYEKYQSASGSNKNGYNNFY